MKNQVIKLNDQYVVAVDGIDIKYEVYKKDLGSVIDLLKKYQAELIDATLDFYTEYGYGEYSESTLLIQGYRLATEKEVEAYEKKRKADAAKKRERRKAKKEAEEAKRLEEEMKALKLVKERFPELLK